MHGVKFRPVLYKRLFVILVMDISSHHVTLTLSVTWKNVVGSCVCGQMYEMCSAGDLYKTDFTLTHIFT